MRVEIACMCILAVGCGDKTPAMPDATYDPSADAISLPIIEAYAKAWGEPDAAARQRLLEYSADENLLLVEPTRTLTSRAAVGDAMTQFQSDVPGGKIPIVGNVRELGDLAWLHWDVLSGNGTQVETGVDLMSRAADQRIARIHSFFGTLPATAGAHTPVQQALLEAWNQPDAAMRTTLLQTAVSDDIVVIREGQTTVSGRSTFSAMIGTEHTASPGRVVSVTSGYLDLPGAWHVAWRAVAADGTTVLSSGVMFALLATDGRISEAVYFEGATP